MLSPALERVPRPRNAAVTLCLAASLCCTGCLFKKQKTARVFTPPPVAAKVPPANVPPAKVDIGTLPPTPQIETTPPETPVAEISPELPPAPPKPAVVKPKPPTVVEITPTPTPPKPTSILSVQERRQLTQELDARIARTRQALSRVEGKNLSAEQADLASTARNFLAQAEQERTRDLLTAVRLAQRAERFAMDLLALLP